MANEQKDKYCFLEGETQLKVIRNNLQWQCDRERMRLRYQTNQYLLNDDWYEKKLPEDLKKNSVKPGVKVPNKRKRVSLSKNLCIVGTAVIVAAGSYISPKVIEYIKNAKIERMAYDEAVDFANSYVKPNKKENYITDSETGLKTQVHWHEPKELVTKAINRTNDPIVAFYIIYYSLDESCQRKKDFSVYIEHFNEINGTDYESVEDFLIKNNFADYKEWKLYVGNVLKEEKEANLDGNDTIGGR